MENNQVTFRKIPLDILIEILNDAWERGADYVDITGVPNELQDSLTIAIREEYMSPEPEEKVEKDVSIPDDEKENRHLSDDDFNELI